MQSGSLRSGILAWSYTVVVAGVTRVAESLSWDGEISSDLPDSVAGVSGVSARTGTIRWAPQQAVQASPVSPWQRRAGWPPVPGDRVTVTVSDGSTSWRVFTGRIDSTEGDPTSLTSRIVDDIDRLERLVSIPPAAELMPGPFNEADPDATWAHVGTALEPWHVAYRAMRAAGYGLAVPRQTAGTRLVETELQGSLVPSVGRLAVASADKALGWAPGFTYLASGTIRYVPDSVISPGGLRLWLHWTGTQGAISVGFDNGRNIALRGSRSGNTVTLTYTVRNGGFDGPVAAEATLTVTVPTGAPSWVEMFIRPDDPGDRTVRIVAPTDGATTSTPNGSIAVTRSVPLTYAVGAGLEDVRVLGGTVAAQAGSISLSDWNAMTSTTAAPGINAWGQGLVREMGASTTILDRKASNILAEVGSATLTGMWLDELGVLQWAPSNVLHAGTSVKTVTTRDIFSLGWVESLQAMRSQVKAAYRRAGITLSERIETLLYQPDNAQQIGAGEVIEDFIGPDGDEEWFEPDLSWSRAGLGSSWNVNFNLGRNSWFSGVYRSANDDDLYYWDGWNVPQSLSIGTEEIEPGHRWLLRLVNSGTRDLTLATPPAWSSLYAKWRSVPLPILRGRGRVHFADATVVADSAAPSWAPVLDHDMGVYGKKTDAYRVAQWLAARLGSPLITLTNLDIDYDPRLQLGDVITVDSTDFMGFSVDALIIGKSESHAPYPDGSQMSLTVRVLNVRTVHTSYEDFENAYQGDTYGALESAWSAATYSALEANPLREA